MQSNSIAYPRFNVKIVASHVGLDVGPDGASHQCVEDLAIYRSIPNFSVISPADPKELKSLFNQILDLDGPVYMRTGRSPVPSIEYKLFVAGNICKPFVSFVIPPSVTENTSLEPSYSLEYLHYHFV